MKGESRKKEYGWFEDQLQKIEQNNSLKKVVTFQPHSRPISNWYQEVGYVLSLSDWESFHYSIAEGVASGTIPLIKKWEGSDKIYNKDWIFNSSEEIVEEIIKLSKTSDNEIEQVKKRNLDYISNRYSLDLVLEKWKYLLFDN